MIVHEAITILGGRMKQEGDIVIPGLPGILEQVSSSLLEYSRQFSGQPVHGLAQGGPPGLIPSRRMTDTASAVGAPPSNAVSATPGAVLDNPDLILRRKPLQVFPIVGQGDPVSPFQIIEEPRQGHIAELEVMPIGFSVCGHADELRSLSIPIIGSLDTGQQLVARGEEFFVGDGPRSGSMIKKDRHGCSARSIEENAVGPGHVDSPPRNVSPSLHSAGFSNVTHPSRLIRRQDREFYPFCSHQSEGLGIHCGFGEPHPFRRPAEPMSEICQSPPDLGELVAPGRQGHDDMVVDLGQRISVAMAAIHTDAVGGDNLPVNPGIGLFEPGQEGRAEVEAHVFIIVEEGPYSPLLSKETGTRVGPVTFPCNPLVPIMIRQGGCLELYLVEPGIFSRRLIEMPVYAEVFSITDH